MTKLSPSQQRAYDNLIRAISIGPVVVVWSREGLGRTTVIKEFHRDRGGEFISIKDYIDKLSPRNPIQMEEALEDLLMSALRKADLVIVDDLDLVYNVICGCGFGEAYPRGKYVEAILESVVSFAETQSKRLVFSNAGKLSDAIDNRCYWASIKKFTPEDYEFLCKHYLKAETDNVDFAKIHRFAPKLHAHQIKKACLWLQGENVDTERFIEYLRSQNMVSNVDLEEVEEVDLHSLKGLDDVIEALEANIIVPLENDELSTTFDIKPKRGVLLAGPPGTGKTTVGRALAHRLQSKFFLIDGTYISGQDDFYRRVQRVFEAAKQNAPSIIFIDDSDVIFENKEDFGLYRYLLTMLDGLESESNKRICVMMTTMDVSSVPPALIRSGRIELWLETKLPDRAARLQILAAHAEKLPDVLRDVDLEQLADVTENLTGADLRRLMEDGKILYAYDRSRELPIEGTTTYFERALETIKSNKEKYLKAEAAALLKSDDGDANPFSAMMRMASKAGKLAGAHFREMKDEHHP